MQELRTREIKAYPLLGLLVSRQGLAPLYHVFFGRQVTWERLGWNVGLDGWELRGLGGVPVLQSIKGHVPRKTKRVYRQ